MGAGLDADEYHARLAAETEAARAAQAARLLRDLDTDARIVDALEKTRPGRARAADHTDTAD